MTTHAAPGTDWRALSSRCWLRPVMVTRMSEATNAEAVARPLPEEPPLMTTCCDRTMFPSFFDADNDSCSARSPADACAPAQTESAILEPARCSIYLK